MASIIVIDPHPILRMGLKQLLKESISKASIQTVNRLTAEAPQKKEPCDLILLSLDLQDTNCQQLRLAIQHYIPNSILLVLESCLSPLPRLYQQQPLIRGIVHKNASTALILASVQLVLAGGTCFPCYQDQSATENFVSSISTTATGSISEASLLGLTLRQYEVLVLLSQGLPFKSIAKQLAISIATTKSHTEVLYQRLNVNNRNAAVYTAIARGATLGWNQAHLQPLLPPLNNTPPEPLI